MGTPAVLCPPSEVCTAPRYSTSQTQKCGQVARDSWHQENCISGWSGPNLLFLHEPWKQRYHDVHSEGEEKIAISTLQHGFGWPRRVPRQCCLPAASRGSSWSHRNVLRSQVQSTPRILYPTLLAIRNLSKKTLVQMLNEASDLSNNFRYWHLLYSVLRSLSS